MSLNRCTSRVIGLIQLAILLAVPSTAQNGVKDFCVYTGASGYTSPPPAYDLSLSLSFPYLQVKRAAGADFTKPLFSVSATTVKNAFAYVDRQGVRHVLLGENWLLTLVEQTGTLWASYSIIAHEFGHHRYDTFESTSIAECRNGELRADHYSGEILCRMGATLEQATSVMKLVGTESPSDCHPEESMRVAAITQGWRACDNANARPESPPEPSMCFYPPVALGNDIVRSGLFKNQCNRALRVTGITTLDERGRVAGIYDLPQSSQCYLDPQEGCPISLDALGVPRDETLSLPRVEYAD